MLITTELPNSQKFSPSKYPYYSITIQHSLALDVWVKSEKWAKLTLQMCTCTQSQHIHVVLVYSVSITWGNPQPQSSLFNIVEKSERAWHQKSRSVCYQYRWKGNFQVWVDSHFTGNHGYSIVHKHSLQNKRKKQLLFYQSNDIYQLYHGLVPWSPWIYRVKLTRAQSATFHSWWKVRLWYSWSTIIMDSK